MEIGGPLIQQAQMHRKRGKITPRLLPESYNPGVSCQKSHREADGDKAYKDDAQNVRMRITIPFPAASRTTLLAGASLPSMRT